MSSEQLFANLRQGGIEQEYERFYVSVTYLEGLKDTIEFDLVFFPFISFFFYCVSHTHSSSHPCFITFMPFHPPLFAKSNLKKSNFSVTRNFYLPRA